MLFIFASLLYYDNIICYNYLKDSGIMYIVKLKKNEEKNIINGFPWVYANEVSSISGKDVQGSVCKVVSFDERFIGIGFINHFSKIIVRMLSNKEEVVDYDFFFERIKRSNDYRIEMGYNDNYRAVFSESDFLPGLIVDKYNDYLSVQFLSLGMEIRKDMIIRILVQIFNPKGIFERSDTPSREKEGLKQFKGLIYGTLDERVIITENGLKMYVDLENGQKTGYFLDQKTNRDNIKYYSKGKNVLDCFCNVGGFSLNAAKNGALSVTSLDISQKAIDSVNENAKLNNIYNINAITCDVFEKLREYKQNGTKFDVIILDPPAFIKSVDKVKEGYKGYLDINTLGLKLVNKGGYLITCSCSQHLTLPLFMRLIEESVKHSKVKAKLIDLRFQGKDHASLVNHDEALYLKVAIIKVL